MYVLKTQPPIQQFVKWSHGTPHIVASRDKVCYNRRIHDRVSAGHRHGRRLEKSPHRLPCTLSFVKRPTSNMFLSLTVKKCRQMLWYFCPGMPLETRWHICLLRLASVTTTWWLNRAEMYAVTVMKVRNLKSRCWPG